MQQFDVLNLVFGVIGLLSFAYAVWANREAESTKRLHKRLTGDIRQMARLIYDTNRETPTEGYARSIMQICDSLIAGRISGPSIGLVRVAFPAAQIPPLQTDIGVVVDDIEAPYGRAVKGRRVSELRKGLLYGPHEPLPVTGLYEVNFRIKLVADTGMTISPDEALLRVDVYDDRGSQGGSGIVAETAIKTDQVSGDYVGYKLKFNYDDLHRLLEYRISIISPHVTVWCDQVSVTRISD